MSATPQHAPEGRFVLPTSLGTSALLHTTLIVGALLFFQHSFEDLRLETSAAPPTMATLVLPPDFMKPTPPPEPEPEPLPELAQAPAATPEPDPDPEPEPKKVIKPVKRKMITRKRQTPPPEAPEPEPEPVASPSELPVEHVQKGQETQETANTSPTPLPEGDGEPGARDGISREGSADGVRDPAASAKATPMVAQPGADHKALLRGYYRLLGQAVRRDYTYPMAARRARIEGEVLLEIVVDAGGKIVEVRVARSSGHAVLDEAAMTSVRSVGHLPAPPQELGWSRKTIRVPFKYNLQRT